MTPPRKIVLIGSAHPLRGGLANFNERLIREYRRRGDDAEIYTFRLQYPKVLFPGKTQYSTEPAPADLPIRIRVNSIHPLNWIRVGRELRKLRPDLLIVKFWMPFMAPCFGTICRIAKGNGHTRVVCVVDNLIPHERHFFDLPLIRYWVRCVDGFIAMSHSVEKDIADTVSPRPPNVLFSPHPLYDNFGDPVDRDTALVRLNLDPAFRYALFFGFIRDYKGLDLLLEAMADERIRAMDLKLIVAGEFYCDPKPYLAQIEKHGLGDRVILSNDFIPDSRVADWFGAADVVVQPYKSATQSGVTQIAYHFSKPMIVTDVGGLAEIVPHGKAGYVVPPEPPAIAGAIHAFFAENKRAEFSAAATREKLKYAWSTMADAIDALAGPGKK